MSKYTRKSCPACGEKPYHPGRLVSEGICKQCRALINEAVAHRDVAKLKGAGYEVVAVPPLNSRHWFPRFYMGERDEATREPLEKAMAQLIYAVSEPVGLNEWNGAGTLQGGVYLTHPDFSIYGRGHKTWGNTSGGWEGCSVYRKMKPEVAKLIRDLYNTISDALEQTHRDGKAKGQDILRMLAEGSLTIDEFNKAQLKD